MISWKKFAGLAALAIILTACSQKSPSSTVQPTEVPASAEQTAAPTETMAPVVAEPDYCTSCHLDKDELIRTAKPVEENAESESEGKG
jgi:hypothetical protein